MHAYTFPFSAFIHNSARIHCTHAICYLDQVCSIFRDTRKRGPHDRCPLHSTALQRASQLSITTWYSLYTPATGFVCVLRLRYGANQSPIVHIPNSAAFPSHLSPSLCAAKTERSSPPSPKHPPHSEHNTQLSHIRIAPTKPYSTSATPHIEPCLATTTTHALQSQSVLREHTRNQIHTHKKYHAIRGGIEALTIDDVATGAALCVCDVCV